MDENINQDQIEFWNRLGPRWVTYQETLDNVWRPLGEAALERAVVLPGERVIDVGCGCGATALDLAEKVGSSGSVIGIDVSVPMLTRARERAQRRRTANLEFVQADASTHRFGGDADLLFSRTGVMFFRDPVAAFTNLRHALRRGGRMVFVCFREKELNLWWTVPMTAAATVVAPEPQTPAYEPGPFSLAEEVHVRAILDDAGFVDGFCEAVDYDLVIGSDVDSATDFCINAGPAARVVAVISEELRARVRAAIRASVARHAGSSGVTLRAAIWIVKATNPL